MLLSKLPRSDVVTAPAHAMAFTGLRLSVTEALGVSALALVTSKASLTVSKFKFAIEVIPHRFRRRAVEPLAPPKAKISLKFGGAAGLDNGSGGGRFKGGPWRQTASSPAWRRLPMGAA